MPYFVPFFSRMFSYFLLDTMVRNFLSTGTILRPKSTADASLSTICQGKTLLHCQKDGKTLFASALERAAQEQMALTSRSSDRNLDSSKIIIDSQCSNSIGKNKSWSTGDKSANPYWHDYMDHKTFKIPFVMKLHLMLRRVEQTGDCSIVSWLPCGKAFRVHKRSEFVRHIVPFFFNQSKFKSFQRQLHLYGFDRIHRGDAAGAYKHPKFVKGIEKLCLSMKPRKIIWKAKEASNEIRKNPPLALTSSAELTGAGIETSNSGVDGAAVHSVSVDDEITAAVVGPLAGNYEAKERENHPIHQNEAEESFADGDVLSVFGNKTFHFLECGVDFLSVTMIM